MKTYPEEIFSGAGVEGSIENITLFGQIVGRLYGRQHALDREKGGKVGGIGRDDDQSKEPPGTADNTTR